MSVRKGTPSCQMWVKLVVLPPGSEWHLVLLLTMSSLTYSFLLATKTPTFPGFPSPHQPLLGLCCHLHLLFPNSSCLKSSEPSLLASLKYTTPDWATPPGTTPLHPAVFLACLNGTLNLSLQSMSPSQEMAHPSTQVLWPETCPSQPRSLP